MVRLPAATFTMGSPETEAGRDEDEILHRVKLGGAFEIGQTEVTQAQWTALMGANPSMFSTGDDAPRRPVEQVSWFDALQYLNRLSRQEGLPSCYALEGCSGELGKDYACTSVRYAGPSCRGYRLPTEAEWEYAARAGNEGPRYGNLPDIAWFGETARSATEPVAGKGANPFGLYDMIGNVWEWTNDDYQTYSPSRAPEGSVLDPGARIWSTVPSAAVLRGCAWINYAEGCRAAVRGNYSPDLRIFYIGFRPARSVP